MLKLHLDTDIGGDIDDLCALAMVLNWPDTELLAITTVAGHQGKRAGYARYALVLADREDIPVAAGADASLDCYRSWQGLPDEGAYWPEPIPPISTSLDEALSLLFTTAKCLARKLRLTSKDFVFWLRSLLLRTSLLRSRSDVIPTSGPRNAKHEVFTR